MKKPTMYFGKFKQYDKVFLTSDNGIDIKNVVSIAFSGERLYITQPDCVIEYADGKTNIISIKASKLFYKGGKLYAAVGNSLAEIKNGKAKKIADFDCPVTDISIGLDGSFWLITQKELFLNDNGEFKRL